MRNFKLKITVFSLALSAFFWFLFFLEIEVVAPGEGITSIRESDVVLKMPERSYVVSLFVSQGDEIKKGQPLMAYRNLDDEYEFNKIEESLLKDVKEKNSLIDERCFLLSDLFSESEKPKYHAEYACDEESYTGGSGGQLILQYYEDYLLEKSFNLEMRQQRNNKMKEMQNKLKLLQKKRKALLRGRGETVRFYDLESEISDLNNEILSFSVAELEDKKKIDDKYMIYELRRSERILTIDEQLEKLKTTIIDKQSRKELLAEKAKLSVIRSPIDGNVLKMTDGLSSDAYVEEAATLFVLKKDGRSQEVDAKFDSRFRFFLKTGQNVRLKIESPGFTNVYDGEIIEVSSDSIEYEEQAKAGKRFYRAIIKPEARFVEQSLNLGMNVQVFVVASEITPIEYMTSVFPGTVQFNVW